MLYKRFLILIITILPFFAFQLPEDITSYSFQPAIDSSGNPIFIYGEYIFHREKCKDCHSLSGPDTNGLISLDGLGGRYSNQYHYYRLLDPSFIKMNSKMPSFGHLENNLLDSNVFYQIIPAYVGNMPRSESVLLWMQLLAQADSVNSSIPQANISGNKTELLALIAYLQSIPASPELEKRYALARAAQIEIDKNWEAMMLDSNNILFRTASRTDRSTIDSGSVVFKHNCTPCHGIHGEGIIGPNLTDEYWLHGGSIREMAITIGKGVPDKGMKPWRHDLNTDEIGQVIAYIRSLRGTNPKDAKGPQGTKSEK
jgi:cytochrome c oxidase cbb3-type subunit III